MLKSDSSQVTNIAIDYVTGNIYLTDLFNQYLAVCSKDFKHCKAIINGHQPFGIALHPQKGQIYWTDYGGKPMIAVASMDGTSSKQLITENIHRPSGLALDWPNDRLYWVDTKISTIESCKLDGSDRRPVISNVLKHPYGIAVFEDKLFWSDLHSKSVQSCDKFTGKNRTIITRDAKFYFIQIHHPSVQPFVPNPCINSPCSHLCCQQFVHMRLSIIHGTHC